MYMYTMSEKEPAD